MAEENTVLIKDLLEATEVDDNAYIPVDDGELTKKISVENFNASSNQTAKAYAEAAAASAQTASETVANINLKVDQAQGYANTAQTQAGYASTYADNAQTYAGNAQGYANTASGHATNASASASAASGSADAAADNALLAQSWAEGNTGAREGENTNNARYWANKAQSAAQITIDDHLDPQSTNPVENKVIYEALNEMHTGGSNIDITTIQTSLYGKDVTISDGTTTYTEQFDLTGKAEFEGVLLTGELTITSTDGTYTATATLTVPYFGNYSKSIAFFTATIAVTTTTSQFNGLTVSAKKNGVVMGSGTFSSGSASFTVPETGAYILEVTLDWKTYTSSSFTVSEETTYNETINGFIAPISLTTPTTEFYNENIAVTLNGNPLSVTLAFDNTGSASFTALQAGSYVFTLTYGGEPYTASVAVSAETSYSEVIKMWTATINITTASSQLQGQTIKVYKGNVQVGTTAFNAGGSASFLAHEEGTYKFGCIADGYEFMSDNVVVSAETTYSTTITYFAATLAITTTSSDLYSQTITISKGGATVGTTAFSAQGSASYTVHETGTYTLDCEGYTATQAVSEQTTYNVSINAGLDLAAWITAGSTTEYPLNPSSYADFAALEADEAAVRQLMLVHDAVDYLATASAGDTLMQSVINSDICAKWITLSDYALDTLYANSDIADVMDTADKYGYGEWVKLSDNPETWGAKGNVPIMTANNAPYGTAISNTEIQSAEAFRAFNTDGQYGWCPSADGSTNTIGYMFVSPVCLKEILFTNVFATEPAFSGNVTIQGYDGNTWHDIGEFTPTLGGVPQKVSVNNSDYYIGYQLKGAFRYANSRGYRIQFYGRELKPLVPVMTADNVPRGVASASGTLNGDARFKAFHAFDGAIGNLNQWVSNYTNTDGGKWLQYEFAEDVKVRAMYAGNTEQSAHLKNGSMKLLASNDGFVSDSDELATFTYSASTKTIPLTIFNNSKVCKYHRLLSVSDTTYNSDSGYYTQFSVVQFYGMDYSEKEFATGSTAKWIYDHGVELETLTISGTGTKGSNAVTLSANGAAATASITFTSGTWNTLNGKTGLNASGSPRIICGSGYAAITDRASLDVSAITGANNTGASQTASGTVDIDELWLE